MNQVRITRCGEAVFAIGQIFDPNDLIDVRTVNDPVALIEHQFDRYGMASAANQGVHDVSIVE